MKIDYQNRRFAALDNSENGEVSAATVFHYRQEGDIVSATYGGGEIVAGHLIARVDASGQLDMRYHHVNTAGELMTGICQTRPEVLPDGRLRLHEQWQWTCGDRSSGTSILEEIPQE